MSTGDDGRDTTLQVSDISSLESASRLLLPKHPSSRDAGPVKLSFRKWAFPPHFDEQVQRLMTAMTKTKRCITTVSIQPEFLRAFAFPATVTNFCKVVGRIPSLKTLDWIPGGRHIQLCAKQLALILEGARNLETVICHWTVFGGTTRDFVDLARSFHQHPTLKSISFKSCVLVRRNRTASCMDPVLETLRTVPKLDQLTLSGWIPTARAWGEGFETSFRFLSDICSHPTLTSLALEESLGLASSQCLEETMSAIQSNSSLRTVNFYLGEPQERECTLLGQLIRNNTCIRSLSLRVELVSSNFNEEPLLLIVHALQNNSTLKHLTIHSGNGRFTYVPGHHMQETILSLLDTKNFTLTDIDFLPRPRGAEQLLLGLEYYVTLNKSGRKRLLENPDAAPKRWLDALTKSTNSVSALFYFLSRNPALCEINRKKRKTPSNSEEEMESTQQRPAKKRKME